MITNCLINDILTKYKDFENVVIPTQTNFRIPCTTKKEGKKQSQQMFPSQINKGLAS